MKQPTGGKGVDVILDMVGGDYVPRELKCLAEEGRLVMIAFLRGPKTELDLNELMRRRLKITGSTLRPRPIEFKGAVAASLRSRIWPLIEAGRIKPVIFRTFPLEQAADAHRLMESSAHIGKIVPRSDMRRSTDCLLVVDVQNDFMPGGALAVPRGDEIVPLVNRIAANFAVVVLTQDWHPAGPITASASEKP